MMVTFEHSQGPDWYVLDENNRLVDLWTQPCAADSASTVLKHAIAWCFENDMALTNGRNVYSKARKLCLGRT